MYRDNVPTKRLQPGDTRVATEMNVLIDFRRTTSLRIPFRELSKDWMFDSIGDPQGQKRSKRRPAWMDFKLNDGSSLRYAVPMVSDEDGCKATLDLNVEGVKISGLDNFEFYFLTADACRVWSSQTSIFTLMAPGDRDNADTSALERASRMALQSCSDETQNLPATRPHHSHH